mgnify:CR=1 FL=1
MPKKELHIESKVLHAGHTPDSQTLSRAVPIYQTTSYVFKDTQHAADLFALRDTSGFIYTRIGNPTTDVLERRLAAIHDGTAAICTASGMSAVFYAVAAITGVGQNIVSGSNLYGGTHVLFENTLKRFGIEVRFVDTSNPADVAAAMDANTRLVFTESIGNPKCNVDDMRALADVAHRHQLPFVVDNTVSPPPIFSPFAHGADIVVVSLTKIIGGHGTSIGGIVIAPPQLGGAASGARGVPAGRRRSCPFPWAIRPQRSAGSTCSPKPRTYAGRSGAATTLPWPLTVTLSVTSRLPTGTN